MAELTKAQGYAVALAAHVKNPRLLEEISWEIEREAFKLNADEALEEWEHQARISPERNIAALYRKHHKAHYAPL